MKRMIAIVLIVISMTIGSLVGVAGAYAIGEGASWTPGSGLRTGGPTGSKNNCNAWPPSNYAADCVGYSWLFYKANRIENTAVYYFPYVRQKQVYESTLTVIPGDCAAHPDGGFWHYGVKYQYLSWPSPQQGGYVLGISDRYSSGHYSTGAFGWGSSFGGLVSDPNQTIGNGLYSAYDGYIGPRSMKGYRDNVLRDFITAYNYDANHTNKIRVGDYETAERELKNMSPNIGAFCWWPGMERSYKGQSNVSVSGSGLSGYEKTEVTTSETKEVNTTSKTVKPGDTVTINFSHNPYIDGEAENGATWSVRRYWQSDAYNNNAKYDGFWNNLNGTLFEAKRGEVSESESSDSVVVNVPYGNSIERWDNVSGSDSLKIGRSNPHYYSGDTEFVARDVLDVTFKTDGIWRFCETLTVKGPADSTTASAETTVCAVIKVETPPRDDLRSKSDSTNYRTNNWVTTGVQEGPREAISNAGEIYVGDSVTMVFSHNIYSKEQDAKVSNWRVDQRNWAGTVLRSSQATRSGGEVTMSDKDTVTDLWTVPGRMQQSGGGGDWYIVWESYDIRFDAPGDYKLCEVVYMEGHEYTSSCVKVKVVRETLKCTDESLGWTPSSYTNSWTLSNNAIVGKTSVLSKIRNEDLTNRGRGAYINWLGVLGQESTDNWQRNMEQSGTTYARPSDTVEWVNCYYPGAQAVANKSIIPASVSDEEPFTGSNTLTTGLVKNQTWTSGGSSQGWTNQYAVQSNTGSKNGVFRTAYHGTLNGLPNTILPADGVLSKNLVRSSNELFALKVGLSVSDTEVRQSGNKYKILNVNDAGKIYSEKITTDGLPYMAKISYAKHSWDCLPCDIYGNCSTCYHNNSFESSYNFARWSDKSTGTLTSSTRVIVPYNFINSAGLELKATTVGSEDVVYPGDQIEVRNTWVKVGNRANGVTESTYTTQVDNAEVRLVAYVSSVAPNAQTQEQTPSEASGNTGVAATTNVCDSNWLNKKQCMEVNEFENINPEYGTTTLNREGNLNERTHSTDMNFDASYNVFDGSAGDWMCFVIAVYPWRSGPEGNSDYDKTTDPGGDHRWLITAPQCKQIAKKPTMQALGSSIYTAGNIMTSTSRKQNLYNSSMIYQPLGSAGATYFGSFVEEGLTANGLVKGFASGAATGRASNPAGYGSSNNPTSEFCNNWVALTLANKTGGSRTSGMICNDAQAAGYADITDASIIDREALVDYFIPGDGAAEHGAGTYTLTGDMGADIPNGSGKSIRYLNVTDAGKVTISGGYLVAGDTRVVRANGNIEITGDITYNGNYTTSAQVPKAVIYARGNISINCNVGQIDAILIADGIVYSCNEYKVDERTGDMESRERSVKQLVVNGAILADRVEMGRTYGMAVGEKTGLAAEVVNYDTSALVWGRSAAGAGDSSAMSTVYMHELAPRY